MGEFVWGVYGGFVCTRICDGDDAMITNRNFYTMCINVERLILKKGWDSTRILLAHGLEFIYA